MAYYIWDVSHVLLGHTVIFGLRTKNLKTVLKKNCFFQPWVTAYFIKIWQKCRSLFLKFATGFYADWKHNSHSCNYCAEKNSQCNIPCPLTLSLPKATILLSANKYTPKMSNCLFLKLLFHHTVVLFVQNLLC